MADHVYTFDDPPSRRDLERACRVLQDDGLIAYPTEVNWAFGCDFSSPKALRRLQRIKPDHPRTQPFSFLCSSVSMVSGIANVDNTVYPFLKRIWPGPFTMILERSRNLPKLIEDKRRVVGVRIPDSRLVLGLIQAYGKPLLTTSVPEQEDGGSATFGYQIEEQFGHLIDLILDLGLEVPRRESTIIDFSAGTPELIREGVGDPAVFDL